MAIRAGGGVWFSGVGLSTRRDRAGVHGVIFYAGPQNVVGWSFTTTQAITVSALDAWTGGTGQTSYNVRLYNAAGTTLASATVLNTDPIEGAPSTFYKHAITPVALAASTTYYIAMDQVNGFMAENVSGLTTSPLINYTGEVYQAFGSGTNPTTDGTGGALNPGLFGPNFDATPTAVPEPGSMILLGLAAGGVGFTAWLRRRRALAAAS